MAYIGTTAASSIANPPQCVNPHFQSGGRFGTTTTPMGLRLWMFGSTDTSTSPFTANYFSDAQKLGMRQGDVVICVGMTSTVSSSQWLALGCVSSVSTDGAGLSTFSFISST